MNLDAMVTLDTFRVLLEHDHLGELVAHVHYRKCGRSVEFDPRRIPPAPLTERDHRRFWCMGCGGRGADVRIGWTIPHSRPTESNVVRIRPSN